MFHTGVPAPVPSVSTRHTPGTSLLPIRPGACTSCLHAGPLPMGRHAPCRLGDHEPPWQPVMPDGDGVLCHPAGTRAASDLTASPTKRRDQGLPLVTCHGFSPPTFLHQGLALRASVPAITEAIRPGGAGLLSWSCGWHDRRKRQGEPERSSTMTCGPSHPSVPHQAPYPASQRDTGIVPSVPDPIPASLRSRGHVGLDTSTAGRAAGIPEWVEVASRRCATGY
jgi:hypothetical protein